MSDDGRDDGIVPEAYAAFDGRKMTAHEIGTWPAYRDGYAAGLAARTSDPDASRLISKIKSALAYWKGERAPHWIMASMEIEDAIAEHEVAKQARIEPPAGSREEV